MESISFDEGLSKSEKYRDLFPQIKALIGSEQDALANQANFVAALKEAFGWWWIGFYFVKENQLVLGPFQGPVACTRIDLGKGVCGTAWKENKVQLVPDVHKFPGHIACSANSRSEIVLPINNAQGQVMGVLDIDSEHLNHYDQVHEENLKSLLSLLKF